MKWSWFKFQVFSSQTDRLIPVWAWQTGYHDYTRQALEDLGARASNFKALGITSYFSCSRATHLAVITHLFLCEKLALYKTRHEKTYAKKKKKKKKKNALGCRQKL